MDINYIIKKKTLHHSKWRNISKDLSLHAYRCENLQYHFVLLLKINIRGKLCRWNFLFKFLDATVNITGGKEVQDSQPPTVRIASASTCV